MDPKNGATPMSAGTANAHRHSVFSLVLVGIDGFDESREAARQAAILVDGELTLLASYDVAPAIAGTGVGVPFYYDEDLQRAAARGALERAREVANAASPTGKVVPGRAADVLVSEVERELDTLLVVASDGLGRLAGLPWARRRTRSSAKRLARCSSHGEARATIPE
jgi:nucleotide-binding universal stress UspA family protein